MNRLRAIVPALLLAVIAVAPIPLASNRDWASSPIGVVIGAVLLFSAAVALFRPGKEPPMEVWLVVGTMTIIVIWVVVQTTLLSWSVAPDGRAVEVTENEQSLTALMRLLTYGGVFVLSAHYCRDAPFADRLLVVIILSLIHI